MKKRHERTYSVRKQSETPPKQETFRTTTDRAGTRRPIEGRIGPDGGPVYPSGSYPRQAPTSSIKCGDCGQGETCAALIVCRSFLSPRAGFTHKPSHVCGYGRARELVGA